MKKLMFIIVLLFGCYKDTIVVNDIYSINNNRIWIINYYSKDNIILNTYNNHTFSFIDNKLPNCADFLDGACKSFIFGGYYVISEENGILKLTIILPDICDLKEILGKWNISIINGNTIYLFRENQKLQFKSI